MPPNKNTAAENKPAVKKEEPRGDKLKLALKGLAAAGAAALVIGVAIKAGKNNSSKVNNTNNETLETLNSTAEEIKAGIKKFFDNQNKTVEGIRLEKGKALSTDGSGFTGEMKTMNNKCQTVTLKYRRLH